MRKFDRNDKPRVPTGSGSLDRSGQALPLDTWHLFVQPSVVGKLNRSNSGRHPRAETRLLANCACSNCLNRRRVRAIPIAFQPVAIPNMKKVASH